METATPSIDSSHQASTHTCRNPKWLLCLWLVIPWLGLFSLRFAVEWVVRQPSNDLILAWVFGAQTGWSCASLFAIATFSFLNVYQSRVVTIFLSIAALCLTLLIARTSYHTNILETATASCSQLAAYYVIFTIYGLVTGMPRKSTPITQSQFSLQDTFVGFTILAVFLALIRVNANRIQPAILQDWGLTNMYPNSLVAYAAFGLIQSLLGISIIRIVTSQNSHWLNGGVILVLAAITTLVSALLFFANSTLFHGYKFELQWSLETLKYQTPMVAAFTLWFSASIYLFRFLGLFPISQPRVLT